MRVLFFLFTFLLVHQGFGSLKALPYFDKKNFKPFEEINTETAALLPAFSGVDQFGKNIDQNFVKGRINVVHFFSTACDSNCKSTVRRLKSVQKKLRKLKSVNLISFTTTPQIDTPEKLKRFGWNHRIPFKNWYFVGGQPKDLYPLGRLALNRTIEGTKANSTDLIYIFDKNLYLRGFVSTSSANWATEIYQAAKTLAE